MTESEITVEILKEIRDAVRVTNVRIDETRVDLLKEIRATNTRLDETRVELRGRLDNVEGALLDLAEQQRFVVRYTRGSALRDARLDGEVAELRGRVDALEAKLEGKRS